MHWTLWLALAGAFGLGVATGMLGLYITTVRSLVGGYTRLRYYGFRPDPIPEKPKTIKLPNIPAPRED